MSDAAAVERYRDREEAQIGRADASANPAMKASHKALAEAYGRVADTQQVLADMRHAISNKRGGHEDF